MRHVVATVVIWLMGALVRAEDGGWVDFLAGEAEASFKKPSAGWTRCGAVRLDPSNPKKLLAVPGDSIWSNLPKGNCADLYTQAQFTNPEVEIEFCIPNGSNSGVKLLGVYEIQISDSYGKKRVDGKDCGGIYPRTELRPVYRDLDLGIKPLVNACGKPGEWQSLRIVFHGARFEAKNGMPKKVQNARFDLVELNGQVVHKDCPVETATGLNWTLPEPVRGPLMLQLDHGPVAVRKFRARELAGP
ncbi:MAG: DUF1080 domain-containing protein [Planctomycetota bacterium]|nr:DUF1080 domain-containing protein [Planctomycetota bacterium]